MCDILLQNMSKISEPQHLFKIFILKLKLPRALSVFEKYAITAVIRARSCYMILVYNK